ncbi:MAG: hypothetical protein HY461_00800 [Parcubacteria group bacterium]|nr:hypothetical protein [Parcubacteria group bacterium]
MSQRQSIKIVHAALDEVAGGDIVLRGVIDPDSLGLLQVADYQREVMPLASLAEIIEALTTGQRVPDIELGMRGQAVKEREGAFFLLDDVFIVDGLQRVSAAKKIMEAGRRPHLGATIYLGTNEEWERRRFQVLNALRSKLSPNVLARNNRHDYRAIDILYHLTTRDTSFVLNGRVCWQQRRRREELMTALTFLRGVGGMHAHLGPGRASGLSDLCRGIQQIMERVGERKFRANVRDFYDLVEESWGIRNVVYNQSVAYLRTTFLITLAQIFSVHKDVFFDTNGTVLTVGRDWRRKLSQFPVADPHIKQISSAGGMAGKILYRLLIDHLNHGKRTKRLIEPDELRADDVEEVDGEETTSES